MTVAAKEAVRAGARASGPRAVRGLPGLPALRPYWELTKPGITRLVVFTTAAGFYLASAGPFDFLLFFHAVFGTALVASGANAFNQYAERDADGRMTRTSRRPLPSGRLSGGQALLFASGVSVAGTVYLGLLVNVLTAAVVATSLVSYILVYTPLKRRTWLATLVGAVPGALPILAGWTAGGGSIDAGGLALFAVVFVWQMPHFFALAWMYREDYARGGFRMLSTVDPTGVRTARQTVLYTIALVPVSLLPPAVGLTGRLYVVGAILLGCAFLAFGAAMRADRARIHARRVFVASVLYLPALLALMVADKAL